MISPAGAEWLKQRLSLHDYGLTHRSYIGTRNKIEIALDGCVHQTYGPKYAPSENSIMAHMEFMLKYDDFSLDFFNAVFKHTSEEDLIAYISAKPNGRYTRKIGFLYEWLTSKVLNLEFETGGNYVDLLEEDRYLVGKNRRSSRWRINNNLLGVPEFCPIVRRTPVLSEMLTVDLKAEIKVLKEEYSIPLMQRIQFNHATNGELLVNNPEDVSAYFRYPDLTLQSVYMAKTIQASIEQDLSDELFFLERYDELKADLQNLIDMPDKLLNDAIIFMHQNKGVFPNRRKKYFPEISQD